MRSPSIGQAASLFSETVSHRAELAAIELDEAGRHARTSVLLLAVSVLLGLLAGFALTLTIAAIVWDNPDRNWWLAGLCGLYLAGAALTAVALHRRLESWEPFADTRNQLQQDQACLTQLIQSNLP